MKKTNPLSVSKIEQIANSIRREFGIPLDSPFPILDILDGLHAKKILTLQYLEDDHIIFEKNTPAKYNPLDNFIYVKESVLEALETGDYRSNFTLAHEFFHFIQYKLLNFNFEETESCRAFENAEWQADEFAGQLLVPTKFIQEDNDSMTIASMLQVSEICVITRKLYYKRRLNKKKVKLSN